MEERKTLLRFLVRRVHLDGVTEERAKSASTSNGTPGALPLTTIDRPLVGVWAPKTPPEAVEKIRVLLADHDYAVIAAKLNEEGFRTAKGLPFDDKSVGYVARTRGWNHNRGKPANRDNHKS